MNNPEILIIDDEEQIRKLLQITLQSNDYKVIEASTGSDGIREAAIHRPDLILLDIGLPDENGQDVLVKLRQWYKNPIIILSVQSDEENIIRALDSGANDYLAKPFRTGELLARIRSSLRKDASSGNSSTLNTGNLEIDLVARSVKKKNDLVKLTATEYALLALLAKNEGRVLTHQHLLREVWGPSYIDQSQYLRVFIAQLRKKVEDDVNKPAHIITESGVGYRFVTTD